jgi:hypothetical protein
MGLFKGFKDIWREAEQQRASAATAAPATKADRWYVPIDGDNDRFVGADGYPPLHLIGYRDTGGEQVLRLCEDSTGLLVSPSDRRLGRIGIYVAQLRGEYYHRGACTAGDFSPGATVRLVREPDNEFDPNAVAVYAATGDRAAAYLPKLKARALAKLLDAEETPEAISIRGTSARRVCPDIAILAARPDVLARLRQRQPSSLPRPAYLR